MHFIINACQLQAVTNYQGNREKETARWQLVEDKVFKGNECITWGMYDNKVHR